MAISLTVVISVVVSLVAIISTVISFTPTYLAGVDGVQSTVTDLRTSIIGEATTGIDKFFATPMNTMVGITQMHDSYSVRLGNVSDAAKRRLMCNLAMEPNGVLTATWWEPLVPNIGDVWFTACDMRFDQPLGMQMARQSSGEVDTDKIVTYDKATNTFVKDGFSLGTRSLNRTAISDPTDFELWAFVQAAKGVPAWTPPWAGYDSLQFSIGLSFLDSDFNPAMVTFDIIPKAANDLLKTLNLRSGGRAVLIDRTTQFTIGTSWDEPIQKLLPGWQDTTLEDNERMTPFRVGDLKDALAKEVWTHLGGDAEIIKLPPTYNTTMGSGADKVFIDVKYISDRYGLSLILVVAMPEKDFMEDVYSTRTMTIIIVVVCLAVMVALGVLFSIAVTRPIDRIADRMYKTASLCDDDDEDPPSMLSEVLEMQEAYATMKYELNRMKSYLPQSVLAALEGDDDEEDEGSVAPSESSSVMKQSHSGPLTPTASKTSMDETASHRSHRSLASRATGAAGGAHGGGLNTARSLNMKRVVVAVFNLVDFQQAAGASSLAGNKIPEIQSAFLTIVTKHARENKGIVDTFQGDHVVVTFNAINNVASSGKRASLAALAIVHDAAKDPNLPRVSVGLCCGSAVVGNMGTDSLQRFNIIGSVYVHALAIERLAAKKMHTHADMLHCILASDTMVADISLEVYYQSCDVVKLPGSYNDPSIIVQVEQTKNVATEEWMYQLEEGENADPFVHINEAYAALANDDLAGAKEEFAAHMAEPHAQQHKESHAVARLKEILDVPKGESFASVVTF